MNFCLDSQAEAMRAELGNNKGERITICDSGTFDAYIADGWSVLSIATESKENGKSTSNEKRPEPTRQKRRRTSLLKRE